MAAPAQLTKDQVRDLLRSYADAGRPRPNYDQMLRDLGARVGKPGRHGSIPRLIKLLHEIEEDAAGHAQAALPDPVAAQAATLWSTIEAALEAREAELNAALDREREALAASRTELETRMRGKEDALADAFGEIQLRDEVIAGKEERIQALTTELAQARQALADTAAVIDLHAAREADLTLRLSHQAKAAAEREQQLIQAHEEITEGLRTRLHEEQARLGRLQAQLDQALTHAETLERARRDGLAQLQAAHTREIQSLEARLTGVGSALGVALQIPEQIYDQIQTRLDAHQATQVERIKALQAQIATAMVTPADLLQDIRQLREAIEKLVAHDK